MNQASLQTSYHALIRSQYPARADHDWFLLTDGSGYLDGVTGSASILFSPTYNVVRTVESGATQSSVARAEFQAMLNGLHILDEIYAEMLKEHRMMNTRVYWVADREDLVLSVARNLEAPNMPTLYKRKTNLDLWRAFSYYEERFQVTPIHFPKTAVPLWFERLDYRSTEIRTMFMQHQETWTAMDEDLQAIQYAWNSPAKFKALTVEFAEAKRSRTSEEFNAWYTQQSAHYSAAIMRMAAQFNAGFFTEETNTCRILPNLP